MGDEEFKLRPWQKEFYDKVSNNKFSLVMGSRGVGKDTIILLICLDMLERGEDVAILNKSERLNKVFVRKLTRLASFFTVPTEGNVLELRHKKSGGVLTALSGRMSGLQGLHSHVLVNELGGIEGDAEEVIAFAYGSVGSRPASRLIIATNATDPNTWLHDFWTSDEARFVEYRNTFAHMNVTVWDVYPEGLPPDIAAQQRTLAPALWAKWYENQFVSTEGKMVPDDVLESMPSLSTPYSKSHSRVAAIDIGATNDPTALVVLGKVGDAWHVVAQERVWNMPLSEQPAWIQQQWKKYKWRKALVDSGGVGLSVWQGVQHYGWAEKGHWSPSFYKTHTEALTQRLTDKEIVVPKHTPLWNELRRAGVDGKGVLVKKHWDEGNGKKSHMDLLDALLGAHSLTPARTRQTVSVITGGTGISQGSRGLTPLRPIAM